MTTASPPHYVMVDLERPIRQFEEAIAPMKLLNPHMYDLLDAMTNVFEEPDPEYRDIMFAAMIEEECFAVDDEVWSHDTQFTLELALMTLGGAFYDTMKLHGLFDCDPRDEYWFPYVIDYLRGSHMLLILADRYQHHCTKQIEKEQEQHSYSAFPYR